MPRPPLSTGFSARVLGSAFFFFFWVGGMDSAGFGLDVRSPAELVRRFFPTDSSAIQQILFFRLEASREHLESPPPTDLSFGPA